jgi:transcriptional regulator with XRE-family HTH domain
LRLCLTNCFGDLSDKWDSLSRRSANGNPTLLPTLPPCGMFASDRMPEASASTQHKRRRKGVDIRPGSVRLARLEAGLTLSALAGFEVSRQQIHHVESGRSRPSIDTLQRIAAMTGKPLSYFLVDKRMPSARSQRIRRTLWRLELLCAREQWLEAVAFADKLQRERLSIRTRALAALLVCQAAIHGSRLELAQKELTFARQYAEEHTDSLMLVECLDWEAMLRSLQGDLGATAVCERALRDCQRLQPPVPRLEVRILQHLASLYLMHENLQAAGHTFESIVAQGVQQSRLRHVAQLYEEMSDTSDKLGEAERAAQYAYTAWALYAHERFLLALVHSECAYAELLFRTG